MANSSHPPGKQDSSNPRRASLPPASLSDQTQKKDVWPSLGDDLQSLKTRIGTLEIQLDNIRVHLSSRTGADISPSTKEQLRESQKAVEAIKRQLNDAVARLRQRDELLRQREAELMSTQQNVDNLTAQREQDQRELTRLKDTVKNLKGQLADREAKIKALDLKLTQTRHELDSTRKDLGKTNQALKTTQEQLSSTKQDLKATKDDLKSTKKDLKDTSESLKSTQGQLDSMDKIVKDLARSMDQLKYRQCEDDLVTAALQDHDGQQLQQHQHQHHHHQQQQHQQQPRRSSNQSLSLPPLRLNFPPRD